jgi:type II secretion system protein N
LGLSARQATLGLNRSPLGEIVVTDLRVKPLWLSLLTDNPGFAFAGEFMGGQAEGFLRRQGDIQLEATGMQLAFPLLNNSTLAVTGTLEQGRLSGQWPPVENSPSHLSLDIRNARLTGLAAIGATRETLELGTLVLQGNGTGNSFKLESIESRDGQISLTGSGALLLVNPMTKSRINLSGALVPTADLDPQLRELLGMVVKEVAGSFPISVSGTLSRPQIK